MKMVMSDPVVSVCPECGCNNFIQDLEYGEVVCSGCGLVIAEFTISMSPEWRAFTYDEGEARVRAIPLSSLTRELTTSIGSAYEDAYGRKIPPNERFRIFRLRKWQDRSTLPNSKTRNLKNAITKLDILSDKLHTPATIKEEAIAIYRKALDKGLITGRPISAIISASIYAAYRMTQTPRTLGEIAEVSAINKKDLANYYRCLLKELNLRIPIFKAQYMIPKIADKIGVNEKTQQKAVEILERAEKLKMTIGKNPSGLAAAALYVACVMNGESHTQAMIAKAAGVTEVTIRNRCQELKRLLYLCA